MVGTGGIIDIFTKDAPLEFHGVINDKIASWRFLRTRDARLVDPSNRVW